MIAAACSGPPFDPSGPCTTDGKIPGAYPDLEALVPASYQGNRPQLLDSGRTCTSQSLGTLATHGVKELRFAGGTWPTGTQSGLTLATFGSVDGPLLDPAWLAEFYETTARTGKNIQSVDSTEVPIVGSITGRRLDVLNNESFQTVVVWRRQDRVAAVLVANFIREIPSKEAHDKIVATAIDAWNASGG